MNAENLTEGNLLPDSGAEAKRKSKLNARIIWVQSIVFLLGFALLIFVVYKIGFQMIFDALKRIGWGFLLIVALNGGRHFLRSLCIYLAIPPQHRSFKYRYALAARFAGEAVSFMTFTGPLLGEATKAALLKNRVPLSHGIAAVVTDNILYDVSVALLILGGVGTMFYVYGGQDQTMRYVLFGVAFAAALCIAGIFAAIKWRVKPVSLILKKLAARHRLPNFLAARQEKIKDLEENILQFYANRKRTFFAVCGLICASHILSVCEVYTALRLLDAPAFPSTSYIIESLTKVINSVFSFVPGTVGFYEGGNGIILHSLGYTTAVGVTLALVRRGAILFWTFIGLIILLWRTARGGTRKLTKKIS